MAPIPETTLNYLTSLLKRTPLPSPTASTPLNLLARAKDLVPRSEHTADPANGVTPFNEVPNNAVFAIFGVIGAGFVITGIWFFFWAKNGGFYFKENDWDDYKSTVLRRKGPNGTTLSGATATTDLGGGSIVHGEKRSVWGRKKKGSKRYKDFEDDESSQMTSSAGGSTLGSEMSDLKSEKKRSRKKEKKSRLRGGDLPDEDEEMDVGVKDAIRAYRHEKPARVGGLNKEADGSAWDGSTADNSTAASELMSHREPTPTNTPTKQRKERNDNYTGGNGGIRKVISTSKPSSNSSAFWNRNSASQQAEEEQERIRSEARKLQEKGRAAQRRDFSFQAGDDASTVVSSNEDREARRERRRQSRSPTKKHHSVPGSYYEESEVGSEISRDTGTKSYHHPIPGLAGNKSDYAEERRKKRAANGGGYRRGRSDSLDE